MRLYYGVKLFGYCTSGKNTYLQVLYLQQKSYLEVLYLGQKSYLEVPSWKFLSGKEKVIYQMKNLGFRLYGGLVNNKVKKGV